MTYQIAIVSHQKRRDMGRRLHASVNADITCMDVGHGPRLNHYNAWSWLLKQSAEPWAVVLEDDAIPVPGFNAQLAKALVKAPSPIVSLYMGRQRPSYIQDRFEVGSERPECWLLSDRVHHGVGLAIKISMLPLLVDAMRKLIDIMPADEAIGSWAYRNQLPVAYTNPSLVDHDDEVRSLATTHLPQGGRRAWRTGTREHWDSSVYQL